MGIKKLTTDEFISRAMEIHGNKYDYTKVVYVNKHTPVCIICPEHGEFWQSPNNHLAGNGCRKCWLVRNLTTKLSNTSEFVAKSIKVHGLKYDYSQTNYEHSLKKVIIGCPIHGNFYMKPNDHLNGQGCPICNESKLEKEIRLALEKNGIRFIQQYRTNWLGKKSIDFFLPDTMNGIECQGVQHFKQLDYFGDNNYFSKILENDIVKNKECSEHGIDILYYTNVKLINDANKYELYRDSIYSDIDELLKTLKISKKI